MGHARLDALVDACLDKKPGMSCRDMARNREAEGSGGLSRGNAGIAPGGSRERQAPGGGAGNSQEAGSAAGCFREREEAGCGAGGASPASMRAGEAGTGTFRTGPGGDASKSPKNALQGDLNAKDAERAGKGFFITLRARGRDAVFRLSRRSVDAMIEACAGKIDVEAEIRGIGLYLEATADNERPAPENMLRFVRGWLMRAMGMGRDRGNARPGGLFEWKKQKMLEAWRYLDGLPDGEQELINAMVGGDWRAMYALPAECQCP